MAHDVAYEIVNLAKVIEAADKSHALESRRWKMTIGGDYVSISVQFCHDGAGTTILRMPGRKPLSVATSDLRTVLPQLLVDGFTCYWDGLNPAYQKKSWLVKLYDGKKHASGRWSFPTDQLVTSRVVGRHFSGHPVHAPESGHQGRFGPGCQGQGGNRVAGNRVARAGPGCTCNPRKDMRSYLEYLKR